ncbi:MAG: hypothetical protein Q8O89_08545 [Nanoarchaeota archaeon]|nr:hypothetical protein [Nanoarchaeota archaeon]
MAKTKFAKSALLEMREQIDALDEKITVLLSERTAHVGNIKLYQPELDLRLRKLGVDDVYAAIFLHPIYEIICNKKLNYAQKQLNETAKLDVLIQDTIRTRTNYGFPVAQWKFENTVSEKITYNKREQEVLEHVFRTAEEKGFGGSKITKAYEKVIIPYTKAVEECHMKSLKRTLGKSAEVFGRTACKDMIPAMIGNLKADYKLKHGQDREFKAVPAERDGIKCYEIFMLEEK